MKYRYIFFDVANTLLYKPEIITRIQAVLERKGFVIPLSFIEERHKLLSELILFPDKTSRDFYRHFNFKLQEILGVAPTEELADELFEACTYLPWVKFEDTDALDELSKSYKLGIISNWDTTLPEKLKTFFSVQFDCIICSEEVGVRKPSGEIFRHAIAKAGVNPEEALFVGDSINLDYLPGSKEGLKSVLIDRANIYPYFNHTRITNLHQLKSI